MAGTKFTSVITGDVVNSRRLRSAEQWLKPLKKMLSTYGRAPSVWEVYRGDSFQLEVVDPAEALLAAIKIKATIKTVKGIDVRMAIGVGTKAKSGKIVTESNGEAFIRSGEKLEALKKEKQNLGLRTQWPAFDEELNLIMRLSSIAMDNWTRGAAELVRILIDNQEITQKKLAKKLKISQSSISEKRKRAYYQEIMAVESFYRKKIAELSKDVD